MHRRIVIGDVHGCIKTLRTLVEEKIQLSQGDSLYFVGDLIDRGPGSKEVLDFLVMLREEGYSVKSIRGNHEDMFLQSLTDSSIFTLWMANKGYETLRSFGLTDDKDDVLQRIPASYISFIKSFPLYYDLGTHIIVHAGLNFKAGDIMSDEHAMLWTRDTNYDAIKAGNKTIVHGHTPVPKEFIKENVNNPQSRVINIDGGCVYKSYPGYGYLISLDLDSRNIIFQENID